MGLAERTCRRLGGRFGIIRRNRRSGCPHLSHDRPGAQNVPALVAGLLPPVLWCGWANWQCFGAPWVLGYTYQAFYPEALRGLYGITQPDAETGYKLLFSPLRGLFWWSPFLCLAVVGLPKLFVLNKRLFWLSYATCLLQVVIISGKIWDWEAGQCWGARLPSPMLPWLALPVALGLSRYPRLGTLLVGYSVLVVATATMTDACPAYHQISSPLFEINLSMLVKGDLNPSLGTCLGLSPTASLGLYVMGLIAGLVFLWNQTARPIRSAGPTLPEGMPCTSTF